MEEQFKNKLKNYSVDWDKEELLGNLEEELSKEKKRVIWRWRLLLGLLFLLLLVFGLKKSNITADKVDVSTSAQTSMLESTNDKSPNEDKGTAIKQSGMEEEEKINNKNTMSKAKESESRKSDPFIDSITASIEKNKDKVVKSNSRPITQPKPFSLGSQAILQDEILNNQKIQMSSESIKQIPREDGVEYRAKNLDSATIESEKNPPTSISEEVVGNEIVEPPSTARIQDSLSTEIIPDVETNKAQSDILTQELEKEEFPDIDDENPKSGVYIAVESDIGIVSKNQKFLVNNPDLLNRLQSNEETERSLSILNTQLNIGYRHSSNWSIQSGLSYTVINEVFNFSEVTTETVDKEEVLYFIVDRPDTTFVYDTVSVDRTSTRTIRHFNKHRFYSIPLEFGYSFKWRNINLNTRLGMSYAFSQSFTGRTNKILENNKSELISNDPQLEIKPTDRRINPNRIGVNLGIGLEYPFLQNHSLFTMATYRRSPRLTRDFSEQVYHSLSLGVGVRLTLASKS